MEITLADERALLLKEQLTMDHAEGRAWSTRLDAFGSLAKVAKFVQRPRDDDFSLVYREHRYQPFWHIVCGARYIYERRHDFTLEAIRPEVERVTIEGTDFPVADGRITLTGLEHCREEPRKEVFLDGLTGAPDPALGRYLKFDATEIPTQELEAFAPEGTIVVPPQARASAVVHQVLTGMIRSIQADRIIEDRVEVDRVDLYYRPVYAFQYRWLSKEKEAVVEYDALTGKLEPGGKTFQQYLGKFLDPNFLFDVGADTASMLVPGGGIAVKLARKGIDAALSLKKG